MHIKTADTFLNKAMDTKPFQRVGPAASTYSYDTLHNRNTIRLLDLHPSHSSDSTTPSSSTSPIHCSLRQVELPAEDSDASLSYVALSYTWGPATPTAVIYIDGRPIVVRENLFAALRKMRGETEMRTLWVDALCINQGNLYERSHQVGIMAMIYRTAGKVRVWLGGSDEEVAVAFRFMGKDANDGAPAPVKATEWILQRSYWTRVWIIQEVMMARAIDLQCGNVILSWEKFAECCDSVASVLPVGIPQRLVSERASRLDDEEQLLQQTLESLIGRYRKSQCSDPRDRIFALLSLAADCVSGSGLQADYLLPRFELLVKTLQFCRPNAARAFSKTLFEALQNQEDDELWAQANVTWNQSSSPPAQLDVGDDSRGTGQVQITHFVTASSPSRDWVRYHSFPALFDAGFARSRNFGLKRFFLSDDIENGMPMEPDVGAAEIDESNIAIRLHSNHFAILSGSQIAAVTNPCTALGLHANSSGCTANKCSSVR